MSRVCDSCGKGPRTGNNVSHAHNKTRRRWLPNLQTFRYQDADGVSRRMRVCTSCIRSGRVTRRPLET